MSFFFFSEKWTGQKENGQNVNGVGDITFSFLGYENSSYSPTLSVSWIRCHPIATSPRTSASSNIPSLALTSAIGAVWWRQTWVCWQGKEKNSFYWSFYLSIFWFDVYHFDSLHSLSAWQHQLWWKITIFIFRSPYLTRRLFDGPYSRVEVVNRLTTLYRESQGTDGQAFISAVADLACDSHDYQRLTKKIATGELYFRFCL